MSANYIENTLLIDDDPSCVFILQEFINLIDSSISKQTAYSVDEAFEKLEESDVFPEVIYVDLNMPIKSGFDFLEEYENKYFSSHGNTKVIVLTSSLRSSDKEKTLEYSCVSDFKSKSEIDQFIESSLLK